MSATEYTAKGGRKDRIWSLPCPFRKDGTPVLGSFGASIRSVVILDYATWKRLCEEIPDLGQHEFEVGELYDK